MHYALGAPTVDVMSALPPHPAVHDSAAHDDGSHHSHPVIERHVDVAVVGGSAAGLAATLQLSRQRRSVLVVDSGEPRNAPAAHMHSYLGHEGRPPADFLRIAREEVRSYGAEVLTGRVLDVTREDDGFRLELTGGHVVHARRVVAATGLTDELPDVPGLAEHWGGAVIHCPFCHGYEARDGRIVALVTSPMGLHPLPLLRQLTADLTVLIHAGVDADARAYLLIRPYLKRSVRVELRDPRDATPYWLVSSRRPEQLVTALTGVVGHPEDADRLGTPHSQED